MTTVLLGPQRFTTTAGAALRALAVPGPVATINAGWEEREGQDRELDEVLDGRSRNLRLYARLVDVLEKDAHLAAAARDFDTRRDRLGGYYELRLRHALAAVYDVQRRAHRQAGGDGVLEESIKAVRSLDKWYLAELRELHRLREDQAPSAHSDVVAWHRGEVAAELAACKVVVLPGGNVATLLQTLRLFDVRLPDHVPVIAWSAGAMALTSRVVLFHDFAPHGAADAEVWDEGLARLPGLVVLPHARRRLKLDDSARMAVLARRFRRRRLVVLDDGTTLAVGTDGVLPAEAKVLTHAGTIHRAGRS